MDNSSMPSTIRYVSSMDDTSCDCVLVIGTLSEAPHLVRKTLDDRRLLDAAFDKEVSVLECLTAPGRRVIYSPIGELGDYDDVRSYGEAASKAVSRAISAGSTSPLLILPHNSMIQNIELVTLLGALSALYVPIQYREDVPSSKCKIDKLSVYTESKVVDGNTVLKLGEILEAGRNVARDIGGGDPERMAPPRVEEYVRKVFKNSVITISDVTDEKEIAKQYPLFEAVNRAASVIPRHKGRILYLEYKPEGPIKKTLFLVGKGVTYDTGGADVKAGGVMAGMSRDKCGAAAVAGFMQVCALLKPPGIRVVGAMSLVRNSIGENSYVADEIITSRAGVRVRIGNTDAEGRMIMADVLCKVKEDAIGCPDPHLYTIATLTGHAVLSAGKYSICLDNSVARKYEHGLQLQKCAETIGDPFELSTLRREDFDFVKSSGKGEDILQCNNLPSSRTPRGHQAPGAFLVMTSGLDKHGLCSKQPLKYSHLDIAGSSGDVPVDPTASPLLALVQMHLLNRCGI